MNRTVKILIPLVLIVLVSLSSCKKKTEEKKYMSGTIKFELPRYVNVGQELDLYSTGIKSPEGISYYWTSYYHDIVEDTIAGQRLKVKVPDKAGDYTIVAFATYDGYYNSSTSQLTTAVDPQAGGTLKGIMKSNDSIIDPRDNNRYYYAEIGSLLWFTENLKFAGAGVPYGEADAMTTILGNLYSWNDATGGVSAAGLGKGPQGACPQGWSVPTQEDWEDLAKTLNNGVALSFDNQWAGLGGDLCVDATFNDTRVWAYSPDNDKRNRFGWNALPAGYSTDNYDRFKNLFKYGMWWSSTERNNEEANYRYIYYESNIFPAQHVDKKEFGVSVRCVKLKNK